MLAIPQSLQYAISGGIGLFIAYIGFKNAHFFDFLIDGYNVIFSNIKDGNIIQIISKDVLPVLVKFTDPVSLISLIGLIFTTILLVVRVKGAILFGIVFTTIIGIFFNITRIPSVSAKDFLPPSIMPTFLKLDFIGLFDDPQKLFKIFSVILAFSLADIFDTIGTFLGTGKKSGIFDKHDEELLKKGKGLSSKLDKALLADAPATSIGALFGTSNVTTYVESAAGIASGGKTGLTAVFVGILFIASLFIAPFALMIPGAATAPALIVVGILMMESIGKVRWDDFDEAVASFLTVVIMPFSYSIANGIAFGFIFYVIAKIVKGRYREIHPLMYIVTILFILNYIFEVFLI